MKLSISLSDDDVAALDRYVEAAGVPSRSAAIQRAIRMLRDPELENAYAAAWDEWQTSGEATAWEVATADGLADVAR
ncbi:ribbon-helix-helix domain-containing protein [Knoellia sp. CPCC 206453]|uniref:ribbon-helix-helix domain-containing protein n=1 Tax=Knoellia pratensis TaxID=3404796 RepID=UPI00361A281B